MAMSHLYTQLAKRRGAWDANLERGRLTGDDLAEMSLLMDLLENSVRLLLQYGEADPFRWTERRKAFLAVLDEALR